MIDASLSTVECRIENARLHARAEVTGEEIPLESLAIRSVCRSCFHRGEGFADLEAWLASAGRYVLVSPAGCVHVQSFDDGTSTACGVEAAATDWWWPL